MTIRSWAVRIVLFAGALFLSVVLIAFLIVQIQLIISRWRAERLSADMHQIRLYQSTWADAQRLMNRWGAWGHYNGSCTTASCKYAIGMGTIRYQNPNAPRRAWVEWLSATDSISTNGSVAATQYLMLPSQFMTVPSGEQAAGSASPSPPGGSEGITIGLGVSLSVPQVASDFIGR